ncbi:hypothetical protein CERSUDRAFT_79803 [Gelatoporia subvermispora B]|uniref:Nuclear protein DGCR14 n=1 Tax=Ceriporiopsis subvermispora (strain B) TaxID=914234 RepID=M2PZ43_CERS8|nr:hypothetical protein CERSUDRAFT_79803 [Gelatoporia subvermispora B]
MSEAGPSTPRASSSQPPRSLNRQVVLDEDEYTAALSHIIARDFFPSLVHLDATNSYLDALRTQDPQLIQASIRRLDALATPTPRARGWTPAETPYGAGPADTPLRTPRGEAEPPSKRLRYDTDISLDAFQARYTSEDNSSFTQILDEENRKRREKYGWAWEAQKRVEEQRDKMLKAREKLLIEPPPAAGVREKYRIEAPTPAGLLTDGPAEDGVEEKLSEESNEYEGGGKEVAIKEKGELQATEEEEVDVMAPKKDTRPAGVDAWKFKARNALMFAPDANESPYHPPPAKVAVEVKGEPKAIKHGNTRLLEQDDTPSGSVSAPPSPTRSRIDAAIAGTPYRPKSPTINNFSLVPSVPSPTPSELGPAAVKQLMTWGSLTATPRVISSDPDDPASDPAATPDTPFRIAAPSAREQLSHKLSTSAAKSLRAKAGLLGGSLGLGRTPARTPGTAGGAMLPPSWTPRRADAPGNLTPAARRLLDRTTMGTAAARRAEAMGRAAGWEGAGGKSRNEQDMNRVRWTPTPSPVARRG